MKLIIEIDLDNAAFKTERGLDGAEILSTVQNVGLKAAHNVYRNEPFTFAIKDQNGNTVGFCELRETTTVKDNNAVIVLEPVSDNKKG
jgi:hypothetical protein